MHLPPWKYILHYRLPPSTFDAAKVALLGSIADARPASSGKYMLQLQQKYDCKQEMLGFSV